MGNVIEDIQVRNGRGRGGEGVVGESLEEHVIFRRIEGGLVIVDKVYIRRGRRGLYKFNR